MNLKESMEEQKCGHAQLVEQPGVANALIGLIEDVGILMQIPRPSKKVQKKAQARVRKTNSRYVKPDGKSNLLAHLYGLSATLLVAGDIPDARDWCRRAIIIQGCCWNEGNMTEVEGMMSMEHVETKRGLILHVAKRIPCNCLDQMKQDAKNSPKVAFCDGCEEEKPFEDMLWCSGCKVKPYCSDSCRLQHWKEHKVACRARAGRDYLKELAKDGKM